MTIRLAQAEDGEELWLVHTQAIRQTAKSYYSFAEIEAWAGRLTPQGYETAIAKNPFFVAEDEEGQVVGFSELDIVKGEVQAVYVSPTHERRGIGRRLLETLEGTAERQGLAELSLDASLNALAFYEKAGYEQMHRKAHPMGDTGIAISCVRMRKLLVANASPEAV